MKFEIGKYFTTYSITAGLLIAMAGSAFIYLSWLDISNPLAETVFALLFFWFLLRSNKEIWFWSGFFLSLLWFWWILVSFKHYEMLWAIPIGAVGIALIYGLLFWLIAKLAETIPSLLTLHSLFRFLSLSKDSLFPLVLKALGLLVLSYIHPLGFDWLKPELVFVHSYIGVHKWQFATVLLAIVSAHHKKNILYLLVVLLAYSPTKTTISYSDRNNSIRIANTMITVKDKWDAKLIPSHIKKVFNLIDSAISANKRAVILPESVLPFFLNNEPKILGELLKRSERIDIVIGSLYLDGRIHRNTTYLIQKGRYKIANKVVLVPFGERNPLPKWASKIVNRIFFDGAIDYEASDKPTDFSIDGKIYRSAICYEGTSETMYRDAPKQMMVISNNGWFVPSVEPVLQRLLLEYYSRKYGTTIYHSINMSPSYKVTSN